jgi:EAL and modified HD-GYP domain-containing signal transduction protein
MHYLRILQAVNTPDMDFHEVGRLIESEVSIAYKLLKLVNSAAFGVRRKVGSIPQALTLLGQDEIRKWISLLSLSGMADDKPAELIVLSLVRAKFCEIMGADMGCTGRCHDYFLMGLFSLIDAVMDRPMAEILAEIPLPDHACAALLQNDTPMRGLLDLAVAYERGEWGRVAGLAAGMNLNEPHIAEAYLEAHQWSRELFST